MENKIKNILAISIAILPTKMILIWYRLTHTEGFTTFDMLLYPILFGGVNIILILAVNKYVLNKNIKDFNTGIGKWRNDIYIGVLLTIIYFIFLFLEQATISKILPQGQPPPKEIINLMIDISHNPILLAIWLGPVVWVGVAGFEELSRTFFLNCLWRFSSNKIWEFSSIFLASLLIGLMHFYQGTFGIITITIQGLIMALYYYKFRRILPLIISHALYDSFQIILFTIQIS